MCKQQHYLGLLCHLSQGAIDNIGYRILHNRKGCNLVGPHIVQALHGRERILQFARLGVGCSSDVMGVYPDRAEAMVTRGSSYRCIAPGSLDTSLSHAAGLSDIAVCHA